MRRGVVVGNVQTLEPFLVGEPTKPDQPSTPFDSQRPNP